MKTALALAGSVAGVLGRALNVVTVNADGGPRAGHLVDALRPAGVSGTIPVARLGDGDQFAVSPEDIWIVTHWTTAHAVDVACRLGTIDPERVVYFVQDYEPGFVPWSTDFALARATYSAGFRLVVNSQPLATYLASLEPVSVATELVVAPDLDLDRLHSVAEARGEFGDRVGLFFYARPTKPRNLFPLGVAALGRVAQMLGDEAACVDLYTAGETHPSLGLNRFGSEHYLGQTGWDGYYDLLGQVSVGLSLMHSPHPSHPPLDLAVSGGRVVTNRFGAAREGLHPNVVTADADPDALAAALVQSIRVARVDGATGFCAPASGALGRPLSDVSTSLADVFRR